MLFSKGVNMNDLCGEQCYYTLPFSLSLLSPLFNCTWKPFVIIRLQKDLSCYSLSISSRISIIHPLTVKNQHLFYT